MKVEVLSDTESTQNSHNARCPIRDDTGRRLASSETRAVNALRVAVFLLLLASATLVCVSVYVFTKDGETKQYEREYGDNAQRILEAFHDAVERRFGAIHTMATQITSYANDQNLTFPYVTLPDFAMRGSDLRIQADATVVHWWPLVTDDDREEWERFALRDRGQIDEAFFQDKAMRETQDQLLGYATASSGSSRRREIEASLDDDFVDPIEVAERALQEQEADRVSPETTLEDGTGFHPRIWSIGNVDPRGDYINGTGPYLPAWQRSPISGGRQRQLNMNFATTLVLKGVLEVLIESNQAIMNKASFPKGLGLEQFKANLQISQYRHNIDSYLGDPLTFLVYPVFDSFGPDKQLAGALGTNIFWKLFFSDILQPSATPILCVIENSFDQTFSYLVEGPEATYLGEGDAHNGDFDKLMYTTNVNSYLEDTLSPETQSFESVPLNKNYGVYTLRIYPAEGQDYSNQPWISTVVVASAFLFTSLVFVLFSIAVERRQKVVMQTAIENAQKAASTATELNEFLSHEVRNPLSAAISASTFVDSALAEATCITDAEFHKSVTDDVKIVRTSLTFINDFLRSMIDYSRARGKKLDLNLSPTDIATDVLEPVMGMLYSRDMDMEISVVCPNPIVVMTDSLRLKQVVMNLGRNAVKFVEKGFIRLRGAIVDEMVEISIEDSGPGIPIDKQLNLFEKFQTSLDSLGQGTGLGLSLCKSLVDLLGGEIWLDPQYDSGIEGCPGARIVIRLHSPPIPGEFLEEVPLETDQEQSMPLSTLVKENGTSRENSIVGRELPTELRVLFVDDDRMLRKLFTRAVTKVAPGWHIQEAASGEAALGMVDGESFDLMFIDQYMASTEKIMLGTETVRALRSKGVKSVICGLSANDMEKSFLAAGADAFRMKPMPCEVGELRSELLRIFFGSRNQNSRLSLRLIDDSSHDRILQAFKSRRSLQDAKNEALAPAKEEEQEDGEPDP